VNKKTNLWFNKMLGNSAAAERLAASQGLGSMELVKVWGSCQSVS
jgi:hypothetical protein